VLFREVLTNLTSRNKTTATTLQALRSADVSNLFFRAIPTYSLLSALGRYPFKARQKQHTPPAVTFNKPFILYTQCAVYLCVWYSSYNYQC